LEKEKVKQKETVCGSLLFILGKFHFHFRSLFGGEAKQK
jgi:hypothetical protein